MNSSVFRGGGICLIMPMEGSNMFDFAFGGVGHKIKNAM